MTILPTAEQFMANVNLLQVNGINSSFGVVEQSSNKWKYLIASNINFATKVNDAIRLKKPSEHQMYDWLERIVVAGQCAMLFVESLDLNDIRTQRIKSLCEIHDVTLVNLTLETQIPENVVVGPWH
ncbi:hypothetical protein [Aliiglaciecola litoralis]|uniref:Uncharacterized protein n=1 Tax=Aliiglaciecola litoralis TaxID=582857 RepID=A0ABN1LBP6_9ALTE